MTRSVRWIVTCSPLLLPIAAGAAVDISIIGGLSRDAVVQPGDTVEGKILVSNNRTKETQVKIYQTDYLYYANGTNQYADPGSCERSNAAWITITPERLAIAPEANGTFYYTIRVPDKPELVGTYWSLIMVEPLTDDNPEILPSDEGGPRVAVRTVMRYGIQMVTQIGNTGEQTVKFGEKQLVAGADDQRRSLKIDVENAGQRWLSPAVWAEIYDSDGLSIGRFQGPRLRIFPLCSVRYTIDLSQLPAGSYNALIVADNGDENVFGTQAKLEIK
jgi:hypothetical protein